MVELVSAVTFFIVILGALTMALNKTTEIWSPKHTNQDEKIVARIVLDLLEQDLSYAVTDNGVPFDTSTSTNAPPTFFAASSIDANQLNLLLAFVKHSSINAPHDPAPALDAVFYTYYQGALFRRTLPLDYADIDDPQHIGDLLEARREDVLGELELHDNMINFVIDPFNKPEPSVALGEFSLLAARVEIVDIAVEVPDIYRILSTEHTVHASVLPDQLYFAIKLYNDQDWPKFVNAMTVAGSDAKLRALTRNLGFESSRMIQFKTGSGTRLK